MIKITKFVEQSGEKYVIITKTYLFGILIKSSTIEKMMMNNQFGQGVVL